MKLGPRLYLTLWIGGPLVALYLLAAFGAPLLRRVSHAATGEGYTTTTRGAYEFDYAKTDTATFQAAASQTVAFQAAFAAAFGSRIGAPDVARAGRVTIMLLQSHEHLVARGWSASMADLTNNGGYFNAAQGAIAIVRGDLRGLRHELTHLYIELLTRGRDGIDRWLNEGFAQFCETWEPGGRGYFGDLRDVRLYFDNRRASGQPIPPVAEIMASDSAAYRERGNTLIYSAAHALVGYLIERHPRPFFELLNYELERGPLYPQAAATKLGIDLETLQREFDAFLATPGP